MYIVENCLNINCNLEFIDDVNSFILNYSLKVLRPKDENKNIKEKDYDIDDFVIYYINSLKPYKNYQEIELKEFSIIKHYAELRGLKFSDEIQNNITSFYENKFKNKIKFKQNDIMIMDYNYYYYKNFSSYDLQQAIKQAETIGSIYEKLLYKGLSNKNKDTNSLEQLKVHNKSYSLGTILNILKRRSFPYEKIYTICRIIYDELDIPKPSEIEIKHSKFEKGDLLYDDDLPTIIEKEHFFEVNAKQMIEDLKKYSNKNINKSLYTIYWLGLENDILSYLKDNKFKGCSSNFRSLNRQITSFSNKYSIPFFIKLPNDNINSKETSISNSYEEKLKIATLGTRERQQLDNFCNRPSFWEYGLFGNYTLKNKIFANSPCNAYQMPVKLYKKGSFPDRCFIEEINININTFIFVCFWLHRLIPLSNKIVSKKVGNKSIESLVQETLNKYFGKNVLKYDNPIKVLKEEVEKLNDIIQKEALYCNDTKLNEIKTDSISFKDNIENYNIDLNIYPNITICIWSYFYNEYFLQNVFKVENEKKHYTCIKCNKTILGKKHLLREGNYNNIYDISPYLCDECMKERNNKSNRKRVSKSREKNNPS